MELLFGIVIGVGIMLAVNHYKLGDKVTALEARVVAAEKAAVAAVKTL